MAIALSQLAQLTARAGVGRAGTMRAGAAPPTFLLKPASGQIIWNRPPVPDGEPDDTVAVWTTSRV